MAAALLLKPHVKFESLCVVVVLLENCNSEVPMGCIHKAEENKHFSLHGFMF